VVYICTCVTCSRARHTDRGERRPRKEDDHTTDRKPSGSVGKHDCNRYNVSQSDSIYKLTDVREKLHLPNN
jgi:hypothetical protein